MVPVAVPPPETVPPPVVVPYMFPWLSKNTPAPGYAPFELLKFTTVFGPQKLCADAKDGWKAIAISPTIRAAFNEMNERREVELMGSPLKCLVSKSTGKETVSAYP